LSTHGIRSPAAIMVAAGVALGLLVAGWPIAQAQPARAWHMIVIPAEVDPAVVQAALARRGVTSHMAEIVLAAELSEADVEALAERAEVIAVRAPLPGEPVTRAWAPVAIEQCLRRC
jgi:hypothetical protein